MDIDDFNGIFFEPIMGKMSNENKEVIIMGDFNIDLMKIEDDNHINEFYNIIRTNIFVPHITLPTRITSTSKTLIDNIFSNSLNFPEMISGNFTVSISGHLPQFLIIPRGNYHPQKSITFSNEILNILIKKTL